MSRFEAPIFNHPDQDQGGLFEPGDDEATRWAKTHDFLQEVANEAVDNGDFDGLRAAVWLKRQAAKAASEASQNSGKS